MWNNRAKHRAQNICSSEYAGHVSAATTVITRKLCMVQDERGERDFWIPRDMVLCFSVLHE
jgi:hypothetical protein